MRFSLARRIVAMYTAGRMSALERHPFGALVAAAASDVGAAAALANAYHDLPAQYRRKLIHAVQEDAQAEGISPGPALAALLAVESDRDLAAVLQKAFAALPKTELTPRAKGQAWLCEGEEGAAAIVDPLYGSFVTLWGVRWTSGGETQPIHYAITTIEKASECVSAFPSMHRAAREHARAAMVEALWRHRGAFGVLPPKASAFIELL